MKPTTPFTEKQTRMLELLARGMSSGEIAEQLGYQPGTMRVYLHNIYGKLGVRNKTAAILWYFSHRKQIEDTTAKPSFNSPSPVGESFGSAALRTGLLASLGVMGTFIGPYSRSWEVSVRLQSVALTKRDNELRTSSRALWEALLRADWHYAKLLLDNGDATGVMLDSPFDGVVLVAMLLIGGYSASADRVLERLSPSKRGVSGAKASELKLLLMLRNAFTLDKPAEAGEITHLAETHSANRLFKQLTMICAFYTHQFCKDTQRAGLCADAIWIEAEAVRQHLLEVGEQILPTIARLPEQLTSPPQHVAKRKNQSAKV